MARSLLVSLLGWLVIFATLVMFTGCGDSGGSGKGQVVVTEDGGDDDGETEGDEGGDSEDDGEGDDGGDDGGDEDAEPDATGYTVITVNDGGSIKGKVVFNGKVTKTHATFEYITSKTDAPVCGGGGMAKGNVRNNMRIKVGASNQRRTQPSRRRAPASSSSGDGSVQREEVSDLPRQ